MGAASESQSCRKLGKSRCLAGPLIRSISGMCIWRAWRWRHWVWMRCGLFRVGFPRTKRDRSRRRRTIAWKCCGVPPRTCHGRWWMISKRGARGPPFRTKRRKLCRRGFQQRACSGSWAGISGRSCRSGGVRNAWPPALSSLCLPGVCRRCHAMAISCMFLPAPIRRRPRPFAGRSHRVQALIRGWPRRWRSGLLDAACIGGEGTRPASPCREKAGGHPRWAGHLARKHRSLACGLTGQ